MNNNLEALFANARVRLVANELNIDTPPVVNSRPIRVSMPQPAVRKVVVDQKPAIEVKKTQPVKAIVIDWPEHNWSSTPADQKAWW